MTISYKTDPAPTASMLTGNAFDNLNKAGTILQPLEIKSERTITKESLARLGKLSTLAGNDVVVLALTFGELQS